MNKLQVTKQIIDSLTKLKATELPDTRNFYNTCEWFFESCFLAGTSRIEFTIDEQKQIGALVNDNMRKLDCCITNLSDFDPNYAPHVLQLRSGIQFMLDEFKNFATNDGETLDKQFIFFKETESIQDLDDALTHWMEYPSAGNDEIDHKPETIRRPSDVPQSHTWWW